MIERYSLPEISDIWSLKNKYNTWLKVELAVCSAYNKIGKIPDKSTENILKNARFDVAEIEETEKITKHDVIAFLTNVAKYVGEDSRYIHLGLTSSDVGDTSFSLLFRQALNLILSKAESLAESLAQKALKYKHTPMMGRTHGIHAEPITFGFKLLIFYEEINRGIYRLKQAVETVSCGKLSGAVGTFANVPPEVEKIALEILDLKPLLSNQIIQRDIYAECFYALASLGASCEKIALEMRHLMRTEVSEAEESFSAGQKGSSAMPHKKNPIVSENICGLSRVLRSNLMSALEDIALWHERDISHSSVERIITPDSTILAYYILHQLINLVDNMVVHEDKMLKNMQLTKGVIFSQKVLLALIDKGMLREDAYAIVQKLAHQAIQTETEFVILLKNNADVLKYLKEDEIKNLFDINYYYKNIDCIFERSLSLFPIPDSYKAVVKVTLKDEVLDPQGKAVLSVLKSSGFNNIEDVRVGKHIELTIHKEKQCKRKEEENNAADNNAADNNAADNNAAGNNAAGNNAVDKIEKNNKYNSDNRGNKKHHGKNSNNQNIGKLDKELLGKELKDISEKILSNPLIENFEIEIK